MTPPCPGTRPHAGLCDKKKKKKKKKIVYHTYGQQPVEDNVDINAYNRSRYPNPYTPFLCEHELEWAFRQVKCEISKKAMDDLMMVHTIKSNLPKGHLKSLYTLGKKL